MPPYRFKKINCIFVFYYCAARTSYRPAIITIKMFHFFLHTYSLLPRDFQFHCYAPYLSYSGLLLFIFYFTGFFFKIYRCAELLKCFVAAW